MSGKIINKSGKTDNENILKTNKSVKLMTENCVLPMEMMPKVSQTKYNYEKISW